MIDFSLHQYPSLAGTSVEHCYNLHSAGRWSKIPRGGSKETREDWWHLIPGQKLFDTWGTWHSISIWLCRNLCERNEGSELNQIVFNTTTIRNPEQCKFLQELGFQQWFVLYGVKNLRKDLSSVKLFFLPENCVFLISIWL